MKKILWNKFFLFVFIGVALCVFMLFSSACSNFQADTGSVESSSGSSSKEETDVLTLNKTEINLLIGGNEKLKATYVNNDAMISWASDNAMVATVSGTGMITAVSVGSATITASVDGVSATCIVNVGLGELFPTIQLENYTQDSVSVATVDTVNLQSVILFNGKRYEDGRFTYELSDNTVGEIVGDKFFPAKKGETVITVSAIWRGMTFETLETLKKDFTVRVDKSITFSVNDEKPQDIEIYTVDSWGGTDFISSISFVPKAYVDETETECTISVLGAENIVDWSYEDLWACKRGSTTLKLSCTDGNREYSTKITVKVLRPIVEFGETFTNVSLVDGEFDVEKLFGSGAVLVDAYQNGTPLEIRNNLVRGIQSSRDGETQTQVSLYTNSVGYTVKLKGYTKILRDKDDLKIFEINENSPFYDDETDTVEVDGYFLLVNDIKERGEMIAHTASYMDVRNSSTYQYLNGFNGVFEGQGFSLTYTSGIYGFFGNLLGDAEIRNVAFVDIVVDESAVFESRSGAAPVIANMFSGSYGDTGKMNNVYISIQSGVQIGVFYNRPAWFELNNIVIEYGEDVAESGRGSRGSLFCTDLHRTDRKDDILKNIYILSVRGMPVEYHWSGKYYGYATNQTVDSEAAQITYQFTSIYQNATRAELAQTITQYNCDLSGFNEQYWDCSSGTPVWKGWVGSVGSMQ